MKKAMMPRDMDAELLRAVRAGLKSFRIDDRRQARAIAIADYGQERGWLTVEEIKVDEQYTFLRVSFTEAGLAHFGVPA